MMRQAIIKYITTVTVIVVCGLLSSAKADNVKIIARAGANVPRDFGTNSPSVQIQTFGNFTGSIGGLINDLSDVVLTARVTGNGVSASSGNDIGIWKFDANGAVELIARQGLATPNLSLNWGNFSSILLNNAGLVTFMGGLTGSGINNFNNTSYWSFSRDQPNLIVREGAAISVDSTNLSLGDFSAPELPADHLPGALVYQSTLIGNGVTSLNNKAIIWSDVGTGAPIALARTGSP